MAATFRTSAAGGSSSGTSNRTATITPAVGDLLVAVVCVAANTNSTPTCSDNNGSGTYDRILTADFAISAVNYRLSVFVRTALMANTTSTVVTAATGSNTSGVVHVLAFSGMSRAGSSAVRSQGQQNNQAAGTAAPALNQGALTSNPTLVGIGSGDTSTTAPTNWTERQDSSQTNDTVALETATRDSGFTGTTITFGAAQSTVFASFAIELDGSAAPVDLVIQNGSHAHSAANLVLAQQHSLAVASGAHAHSAQNLSLTQVHVLTVQDATHSHSAESLVLTEIANLAIQNGTHGHTSANLDLTQLHVLAVSDGMHGHTGSEGALTQAHVLDVDHTAHGLTSDESALTQVHVLTIESGTHLHSAENVSFSGSSDLGIQDATHGHTASEVAVQQNQTLEIADASHGHEASGLTLTQVQVLSVSPGMHGHNAAAVVFTQTHLLVVANGGHGLISTQIVLLLGSLGVAVEGPTKIRMIGVSNGVRTGSGNNASTDNGSNKAVIL